MKQPESRCHSNPPSTSTGTKRHTLTTEQVAPIKIDRDTYHWRIKVESSTGNAEGGNKERGERGTDQEEAQRTDRGGEREQVQLHAILKSQQGGPHPHYYKTGRPLLAQSASVATVYGSCLSDDDNSKHENQPLVNGSPC